METPAAQTYTKVPFAELQDYLQNTASITDVNYIEVMDITAAKLSGKKISPLGKMLKESSKPIALKLPESIENLHSMENCFSGCTALSLLAAIPDSVTNMSCCFRNCESLIKAPVIPDSVTDISWCFSGCTGLTEAPVIPDNVTNLRSCFSYCINLTKVPRLPKKLTDRIRCFVGCTSLTAGSITVPASELEKYRENASEMNASSEWFKSE